MSLAALPVELIHHVATHADAPGLAALSRTSRSLHAAADRALYRDLALSSRSLPAILTLSRRPLLASH
ncbi:hypothetical protein K488DRAFT_82904, partial [Vararia minispora EC-137]